MTRNRLPPDQPGRIAVVGETLYGIYWRKRLAAALGICRDTLHQWLKGSAKDLRDVDAELIDVLDRERDACAERSLAITALRRQLAGKR